MRKIIITVITGILLIPATLPRQQVELKKADPEAHQVSTELIKLGGKGNHPIFEINVSKFCIGILFNFNVQIFDIERQGFQVPLNFQTLLPSGLIIEPAKLLNSNV